MTLSPLDATTTAPEAFGRQFQGLKDRCTQLERSMSGIGTIIASSYAEAVAQLPESSADGSMILARGGFNPTLFVFDAVGEKGEGAWFAIKATEV